MYAAVVREGEVVASPSGRIWEVQGWGEKRQRVSLKALDGSEDEVELHPRMLRHVNSIGAGQTLEDIGNAD